MTIPLTRSNLSAHAASLNERGSFIAWLPRIFWTDHFERCADHPGVRREIRRAGNRVLVELDTLALADLRSDADYYGGSGAPDWEEGRDIRRSARATLKALGTYP